VPFSNPITGAQGTLVRKQIKSPDFDQVAQTGWAILQDGEAFFFDVTVAGKITASEIDVVVGGVERVKLDQFGNYLIFNPAGALVWILDPDSDGWFLYSDTGSAAQGTLAITATTQTGTDQFGNPYLPGLVNYQYSGSTLTGAIQLGDGVVNFYSWTGSAWVNDTEVFSEGSGFLQYTSVAGGSSPGDGNTYAMGALTQALAGGAVSSAGTTPVPVLTFNVSPGKYLVRGVVFATQGTTAAPQNMAFQGTATRSNTSIGTEATQTGAGSNSFSAVINSASSTQIEGAVTASAGFNVFFMGFIIVTAAGTFTLSIADGTSGDHWKANNNSFMVLEPTQ
jgi:hypothetical protein